MGSSFSLTLKLLVQLVTGRILLHVRVKGVMVVITQSVLNSPCSLPKYIRLLRVLLIELYGIAGKTIKQAVSSRLYFSIIL